MISRVYVEEEIVDHPRVHHIQERLPNPERIVIDNYQEVFNRKSQDFRLQKQHPALILAKKHDNFVLETPEYCNLGDDYRFYYFSHMMNCVYDCRYCFLQGMYDSAHYVVFVNYQDFFEQIRATAKESEETPYFFSGHVNDSLALDQVTGFSNAMLQAFRDMDRSWVELRTKSVQIQSLADVDPFDRCVVAWSMTPPAISEELEHRTPSVYERIQTLRRVQEQGWLTGLRFDPMIYTDDFREQYGSFFEKVFDQVHKDQLHSVTLGPFRLPKYMYKNMTSLYPEEPLFAVHLEEQDGLVSYRKTLEQKLLTFCRDQILRHISDDKFYPAVSIEKDGTNVSK